jgi:hypothetical protein
MDFNGAIGAGHGFHGSSGVLVPVSAFCPPLCKDEQKSITTGSRTCCYKIYVLAFQAIGLLIFVHYNV